MVSRIGRLRAALVVCCLFMVVEYVGGTLANSLAIISDASHLLIDASGFAVSLFAIALSNKPANSKYTFGYGRAETLGALISLLFVWFVSFWLAIKALQRFWKPVIVDVGLMMSVAIIGLFVNILLGLILHCRKNDDIAIPGQQPIGVTTHRSHEDLNLRAAFFHVLGDLLQSLAVLLSSLLMYYSPKFWIADPLSTLLSTMVTVYTSIPLLSEIVTILMEATPVDIESIRSALEALGIERIVDLHVWSIKPGNSILIMRGWARTPSSQLIAEIKKELREKYGIDANCN